MSYSALHPARNLPLNRSEMTRTGRKNLPRVFFHRPSAVMPPAVTTMWMCGWKLMLLPQVWRMEVKPTVAPRYLDDSVSSFTAAAAQEKSRPNSLRGFCNTSELSSLGIVSTVWKCLTPSMSSLRLPIHFSFFTVWHFGQCLFLQELYEGRA